MKMKPLYLNELRKKSNPIVLSTNYGVAEYIRGFGGVCLLCLKPANEYDLKFVGQKECCIYYSCRCELDCAKALGLALIKHNATKVEISSLKCWIDLEGEFE